MSSVSQNNKKCFCLQQATKKNIYTSLEAWQKFCQEQEQLGLVPSPLALQKARKQSWWIETEVTADAA